MNDATDNLRHIFGADLTADSPEEAARRSVKLFVRGRTQLAVYDESRSPTGHVLTAWEAYQAYGLSILEEAVEYGTAVLLLEPGAWATALQQRREELGLDTATVAKRHSAAKVDVERAESSSSDQVPVEVLESIAFGLGLDEAQLGVRKAAGSDSGIATRLKTLQGASPDVGLTHLRPASVMTFAEAASIIRVQHRMTRWLGLPQREHDFARSDYYGTPSHRAWQVGYDLAVQARQTLNLGASPVKSMRTLAEESLGVPVVQAALPSRIAGATISARYRDSEFRGIVLNTTGHNENPLIRRATLAHELTHLLHDPEQNLESLRVDSYDGIERNPERDSHFVEQRANAFAIAFLAPLEVVRDTISSQITTRDVADTMERFGISNTAARYHIENALYRTAEAPKEGVDAQNLEQWRAEEDFALDYFPIRSTPGQRRGRFAGLVAECLRHRYLSLSTAAAYLVCDEDELENKAGEIRGLYPIHAT